jgi:hypothetical protein
LRLARMEGRVPETRIEPRPACSCQGELQVASDPVLTDLFMFFYQLMAYIGVLTVVFGFVTRERRAQAQVASVFLRPASSSPCETSAPRTPASEVPCTRAKRRSSSSSSASSTPSSSESWRSWAFGAAPRVDARSNESAASKTKEPGPHQPSSTSHEQVPTRVLVMSWGTTPVPAGPWSQAVALPIELHAPMWPARGRRGPTACGSPPPCGA